MQKFNFLILLFALIMTTQSMAQVTWSDKEHVFSNVQHQVPITYEFKFANISPNPVEVDFVKTSCVCLAPFWETYPIPQQGIGSVKVTFDADYQGTLEEEVKVYFKDMLHPYILQIKGNIVQENINNLFSKEPVIANSYSSQPNYNNSPSKQPNNNDKITVKLSNTTNNITPTNTPPKKELKIKLAPPSNNTTATITPPSKPKTTNVIAAHIQGSYVHDTGLNANFMSSRAKSMIKEINLIRSNPKGYIPVVESYIAYLQNEIQQHPSMHSMYSNEITVAKELIEELKDINPLSILQPDEGVYKAAQIHGDNQQVAGTFNHKGQDGSMPWDRVLKYATNMKDGNENLVGGLKDVRRAVLVLLIDDGTKSRGHRKTLLNPNWTHVGCYEVGRIKDMPHCWVQIFGQAKASNNNIPTAYAVDIMPPKKQYTTNPINIIKPKQRPPNKNTIAIQPKKQSNEQVVMIQPGKKPSNTIQKPERAIPGNQIVIAQPGKNPSKVIQKPERAIPGKSKYTQSPSKPENNKITIQLAPQNPPSKSIVNNSSSSLSSLDTKIAPKYMFSAKHNTAEHVDYLSDREKLMIAEINFLRSEPKQYIKVVKKYVEFMEKEIAADEDSRVFYEDELRTAEEVKELLERLPPRSILRPHKGIFKAAKIHGTEAKNKGNLDHQGSDGSMPWDRVRKYATDMMDGNENIVGGPKDVRRAVLLLLVDAGIPTRGHRKTLLDAKWNYVACHEIGTIGDMPNNWVQLFGQELPNKEKNSFQDPMNFPPVKKKQLTKPKGAEMDLPTIPQPPSQKNKSSFNTKNTINNYNTNNYNRTIAATEKPIELDVQGFAYNSDVPQTMTVIAPHIQGKALLLNAPNAINLTNREKQLVREINFLRSNPTQYLVIVEAYIKQLESQLTTMPAKAKEINKIIQAALLAKNKLAKTNTLPLLKPNMPLYGVAKNHGLDMKDMGSFSHIGSDGSQPWNRISKKVKYLTDGQEALIGNVEDIRAIVLNLLIDVDFPQRPNQKMLLHPQWNFLGTYEAGNIGKMKDCWVITFGK